MRKPDAYEKKQRRRNIFLTIFIVLIMVSSVFAIVLDNMTGNNAKYNNHKITATDYGYKVKADGRYLDMQYYPSELERINLSSDIIKSIRDAKGVAIVFDPEDNLTENLKYVDTIRYELQIDLNKTVYFGMSRESEKYPLAVVGCENSTSDFPIIIINTSSDTSFARSQEYPDCIIMNAKLKELIAAKDRLVYSYYGIMG